MSCKEFEYISVELSSPLKLVESQPGRGWKLIHLFHSESHKRPLDLDYPEVGSETYATSWVAVWEKELRCL